ncbi:ATP-dependent RNA helicase HrpA [Salinibacterium sp. ZJ450]|uniref:ATP-dependent RNA helicase HrpA n=1 Tax=Salinibacterium sp. ZJ450 TaxID=2708338 RepID=UPI00174B8490|nr:ATP-dependent RNA helicase HrpA [Salinibacterium sp. ZJ450]
MIPAQIFYPPELPVSQRREDIARAISENQVVIVAGATGSGKTTQLPKICLELGRESIGHTQPRRIAARTIAERVAEELGSELGDLVGYQVRFTDRVSKDTKVKLMTDGILLNEMHRDRLLSKYDTIIIDEAHERSLTIDFLLGYLKTLLPKRPDLKVIITSATIDPESFARHFAAADGTPAPIIEVSGRTYPVEVRYRPLVAEVTEEDELDGEISEDKDYIEGITAAIDELAREKPGDVLVFLSGENEIRDAEDALKGRAGSDTEILPLYGRLSSAEQHRVFETKRSPGIRRRVVLATNVAETSLTVPGIKYVVDAGTARISRYSVRSKVQRLPIEAISQASANQRSGRSGRTSDGIAIRLYSEEDYTRRPEFTEPEILRTNLAAVILQMLALGLGDIQQFPFLQPPDSRGIKDGVDLLRELGAVEAGGKGDDTGIRITRIGRQMTQLAVDPRYARMIIETKMQGSTREVLAIAAGLSIQDPRERPLEKRAHADQLHARFADPTSDFLSLLNLWNYLKEQEQELSGSALRRLCRAEYINFLRFREWEDVYRQLSRAAKQLGLHIGEPSANPDGIHKALLSGLLSHIGLRDAQKKDYIGARNQRFMVFPGSGLAKKQPPAVMAAELVETSRLFARTVAAIDPAWAEPLAGDLVKRTYSEPHWEKKQGAVVAYERATLYGVPIVQRRRTQFSRIDPAYARELFIRHALVEGEWDISQLDRRVFGFDRDNRRLRKELEELEERTRRRDILYDDEAVFEFYDRRIPKDVSSTRSFEKWWRAARRDTPELLTMTPETLAGDTRVDDNAFPTSWRQGDQTLSLSYRFEPGSDDDGVTVQIPLPLLARLSPAGFDWLVPGLREDLVAALIKTLPKAIRRNVVPAADWARTLLEAVPDDADLAETPITEFLATQILRKTHTPVSPDDFETDRLPPHLRVTFAVANERGQLQARSKDLVSLQHKLKSRARESVAKAAVRTPHALERSGLTGWDFDELPKVIDIRQGGNVIRAYPALVDEGSTVAIRLMSTPEDQAAATPAGIRRLLLAGIPSPLSYVKEHLSQSEKLLLATSPYQNVQALFDDCLVACVDDGLRQLAADGLLWRRTDFDVARERISASLVDSLYAAVGMVAKTLAAMRDAERALKSATSMTVLPAVADAREQMGALVYPGFVSRTGLAQLRHLPRYLQAVTARMEKLPTDVARDRVWMNEVQSSTARYQAAGGTLPLAPGAAPHLVHARWLLEELRVSLFAQQVGTAEPVSSQRIRKLLGG